MTVAFPIVLLAFTLYALLGECSQRTEQIEGIQVSEAVQQLWAQYSPYFASGDYEVPKGCRVTQVNLIQRHGARFPTSGPGQQIQSAISKLQSVSDFKDPRLNFLRDYVYDLGTNDLVPFGALQSFESGQQQFKRYSALVSSRNLPFVRSSSSDRVISSASNWTAGFASASHGKFPPSISVVLDEAANDTLDDNMCTNAGSSNPQTNAWLAVFAPPITSRLNTAAPGANLTDIDTFNLISQCAFDSVAHSKTSQFCALFSTSDFAGFEYSGDLNKYYGTGYGQALGRVQGVGYVNELIARLTGKPVRDHTQTNSTLDSSPMTFPLNRTIYADFSHDNQMTAIYAAIGLFNQSTVGVGNLNATKPDLRRTWVASMLVPFSARMVTEKLQCGTVGKEYVRILVNDAQQPLEFCGDGSGMCRLDAFVASQAYARSDGEGDWEACFD
ncbi:acid phosphatase [Punctularia strigosozonata HHB-11173 SS5]|uniref:acid phosphatase n=1 Tax=Punctularia strigosozonata (strain HHB-11173) TaxID=741275 RepID=UPI0004417DFB|nr:acid phosphatase [Punctularia strigosozonata HHB-11173 SS5]EIN11007.1 acid phosphatase [Punctularia strigosozonata HHB-11173 SS5]